MAEVAVDDDLSRGFTLTDVEREVISTGFRHLVGRECRGIGVGVGSRLDG